MDELTMAARNQEELLQEKLICFDNYKKNKQNFIQTLKNIYDSSIGYLDAVFGVNIEDFIEEVVTHNYNVCYEIALLYMDRGNTEELQEFAGEIYDDIFDCRLSDALFSCILCALSEMQQTFSININVGEVLVFGNCQNTLLFEYTRDTKSIVDDFGFMMFNQEDTIILQKGESSWENYKQLLTGNERVKS